MIYSVIRPGTEAAEGLSEQFINKRLKIENIKRDFTIIVACSHTTSDLVIKH